ncbi:hypothetical protein BDV96DRAFT_645430 [Lophiotrema nucula]|uniref:Uncharacterized protein n=1 Tax=Lophiotrema nucula TaxID=690887 RepID=A0A6A5ZAH4_9PLEO|nr:hypothetical protein BDV96DRAFT_645430 [Lophiotrema nucula]
MLPKRKASQELGKGLPDGFWDGVSKETKKFREELPLGPVRFDMPFATSGATKRSHGEVSGGPDAVSGTDDDEHECKKIESFFHHGRTEALDPSLVQPTTPLEAQNNILHVSAIGKQYQMDVKDFNIRTRDNQIRAKDHQIAQLSSEVDFQDRQIGAVAAEFQAMGDKLASKDWALAKMSNTIANRDQEIFEKGQQIQQMGASLKEQDTEIRTLFNELKSKEAEIASLRKQRIVDRILLWLQRWLGRTSVKASAITFPLLQMPGEIRNRIYHCALVSRRPIDFWPIVSYSSETAFDHTGIDHTTVLFQQLKEINVHLLLVSRQVYKETVGILYGCNRFRFSDRRGWTVLNGWLTHINLNCNLLTNISVAYPDWASTELMSSGQPFADRHPRESEEMRTIVRRFGGAIIDSPAGPSTNPFLAFDRARDMLRALSNLNSFSFVLPHDVHILAPWTERAAKTLGPGDETVPFTSAGERRSGGGPTRSFIFIHRHYTMPRRSLHRDLDDDTVMGRNHLVALCQLHGATVKTASYGARGDKVSYIVDGGEDAYNVDVPEYIEKRAAGIGSVLKPLGAAKRLLGYK